MKAHLHPLQNHGMSRDLSVSKAENTFAWENFNVRITQQGDDTLLSVTNERGTKFAQAGIGGTIIGWNALNDKLVVFSVSGSTSSIVRVGLFAGDSDSLDVTTVAWGNFGFSTQHPIESILSYESEEVQKVYWVDGVHVLRSCNIMHAYGQVTDTTLFDSTRGAKAALTITTEKDNGGSTRPNGTIQYYVTAYNKLGVETGIIGQSSLIYLSPIGRGGAADEYNNNRIILNISAESDIGFDYIRVYALQRTSNNGTPIVYILSENPVSRTAFSIDETDVGANYLGTIDPSVLLFLGSKEVVASTMTQKDNTLFLGNLEVKSNDYTTLDAWAEGMRTTGGQSSALSFSPIRGGGFRGSTIPLAPPSGTYPYDNQLAYQSNRIKIFKANEKYRFAVVFRKPNGDRSKAFWIGDKVCPYYPEIDGNANTYNVGISQPLVTITTAAARALGYTSAQLYMAQATYADRKIKAQGFLNPTVYNLYDRYKNAPYAMPSWTARPALGNAEFMHFKSLRNSTTKQGELQSNWWAQDRPHSYYGKNTYTWGSNVINTFLPEAWQSRPTVCPEIVGYTGVRIVMTWGFNSGSTKTSFDGKIEVYRTRDEYDPEVGFDPSLTGDTTWTDYFYITIQEGHRISWEQFTAAFHTVVQENALLRLYYDLTDPQLESIKSGLPSGTTSASGLGVIARPVEQVDIDMVSADQFCRYNRQNYFVDTNIVTFHSPEVEYSTINLDRQQSGVRLRIVGAAQITASITDSDMQVVDNDYIGNNIVSLNYSTPNISSTYGTLTAAPMYYDSLTETRVEDNKERVFPVPGEAYYMTYLWHKTGSMINYTDGAGKTYASLVTKRMANMQYSYYTRYITSSGSPYTFGNTALSDMRHITGYSSGVYEFTTLGESKLYSVNVPTTVIPAPDFKYPVYYSDYSSTSYTDALTVKAASKTSDPVSITFNTRPHLLLSLPSSASGTSVTNIKVLPSRSGSNGQDVFNTDSTTVNNYLAAGDSTTLSLRITSSMKTAMWPTGNGLYLVFDGNATLERVGITDSSTSVTTTLSSTIVNTTTKVIHFPSTSSLYNEGNILRIQVQPTSSFKGIWFYTGGTSFAVNIYSDATAYYLGWSDTLHFSASSFPVSQDSVTVTSFDSAAPYLWIGEIYADYEDYSSADTRYGGTTSSAIQNNVFIPCGPIVQFGSSSSVQLIGDEGDTYFQRYDCMLAYPQSENDINQTIDFASVMLETHINMDGRTDKDRGVSRLTNIDYTQFGTINSVYNQENNFLQARSYDEKFNTGKYPTTITWSLEKHPLETNDTWMNITLASTMTVDSMYGPLNALRRFNNAIIGFQDRGISEILFNSRVQVPVSDGVPVELANSGKVEGKRTISNHYGCVNKWSIVEGKSGLYFKDDLSKEIVVFNGQSLDALSTKAKLNAWVQDNTNTEPWTPAAWENTIAFYDNIASDVYFVNSSTREGITNQHPCLVYNENLGNFVGFFSYGSIPLIANLRDRLITAGGGNSPSLYFMKEGVYNKLLGTYYPSYVIWRVTPDAYSDKIWSNLEYRADFMTMLDTSGNDIYKEGESPTGYGATSPGEYNPDVTFDTVRVWNEYQDTGNINMTWAGPGSLENSNGPDIRKKFRIWRADIPRDSHDSLGLDRIRNPWIWLKVQKNFSATDNLDRMRFQLHDMVVKYFTTD